MAELAVARRHGVLRAGLGLAARLETANVAARAEEALRAAQHQRAHGGVGLGPAHYPGELGDHPGRERVACVGVVQGGEQHIVSAPDAEMLEVVVVHGRGVQWQGCFSARVGSVGGVGGVEGVGGVGQAAAGAAVALFDCTTTPMPTPMPTPCTRAEPMASATARPYEKTTP